MKKLILILIASMTCFSASGAENSYFTGEYAYLYCNDDVAEAVRRGEYRQGWDHFTEKGRSEGRILDGSCVSQEDVDSNPPRWWNEAMYLRCHNDVVYAVSKGKFRSGWQHYTITGQFTNYGVSCQL
ncbi:MAG: hypothetical protein EOP04_21165 [Proteobacteria bacterium]|nr:MAG: hypothetical protein EOP04_21165 [Pseudomonadota bacterium]